MAHFDYLKPGGVWSLLSLLSSSIMAEIDRRIYKSINGDEGGVWAPNPTPIIIGGLGLQVTGPLVADDASITIKSGNFLTVESGGTVAFQSGSTITIAGATTISGPVTFTNASVVSSAAAITLTGGSLTITSPAVLTINTAATLNGTMTVGGGAGIGIANTGNVTWQSGAIAAYQLGSTATFASGSTLASNGILTQSNTSTWTLNGTQNYGSTAVVSYGASSTVTFGTNSTVAFSATPTFSLGMSVGYKATKTNTFIDCLRYYEAPNANASILSFYDVVKLPGPLGTSKTYQITNPLHSLAANECMVMRIYRLESGDGTDAVLVRADVSATVIATLKSTSHQNGVTLVYSGTSGQWDVLSYSGIEGTDVNIA